MLQFDGRSHSHTTKQRPRADAWPVYAPPVYPCYYYHPQQNVMMMMVPPPTASVVSPMSEYRPPPRRRMNKDDDDTPLAVLQHQMRASPPPPSNRRQNSAPALHPPVKPMRPTMRQQTAPTLRPRPVSPQQQQQQLLRPINNIQQRNLSPHQRSQSPPQRSPRPHKRPAGNGQVPQRKNSAASHPPNALRSAPRRWPSNGSAPSSGSLVRSASLPTNTHADPEPPSPTKKDANIVTKAKRWFSLNRRQR